MGNTKNVWFGMKVTPEQKQKIKTLARREGTSAKEAVMRLVDEAVGRSIPTPNEGSFLEAVADLVGTVGSEQDPIDLASNQKHLSGFGR